MGWQSGVKKKDLVYLRLNRIYQSLIYTTHVEVYPTIIKGEQRNHWFLLGCKRLQNYLLRIFIGFFWLTTIQSCQPINSCPRAGIWEVKTESRVTSKKLKAPPPFANFDVHESTVRATLNNVMQRVVRRKSHFSKKNIEVCSFL